MMEAHSTFLVGLKLLDDMDKVSITLKARSKSDIGSGAVASSVVVANLFFLTGISENISGDVVYHFFRESRF